jgi:hypothetical protein
MRRLRNARHGRLELPSGSSQNVGRHVIVRGIGDLQLCCGACSSARKDERVELDALTAFGLFAVTAMLVFYALEDRSRWFILAFAGACWLGSAYGFLQGAWPFGLVEAIWGLVAVRRWWIASAV